MKNNDFKNKIIKLKKIHKEAYSNPLSWVDWYDLNTHLNLLKFLDENIKNPFNILISEIKNEQNQNDFSEFTLFLLKKYYTIDVYEKVFFHTLICVIAVLNKELQKNPYKKHLSILLKKIENEYPNQCDFYKSLQQKD